ncbi:hypothetical protein FBY35_2073 [Streptomyces sp. SLBN-118]|uniref:hypothetical protein n=1 Tax=Streptomyces sp. SLBN-118 TaxID=2768454 RepID=UPI0011695988|nr:hypothetical protein [Streptomyces sp. SLBN-118]TQK51661.1 hypothetical protein FBY35_2073 [Streptomyces sp. SLBN-118]
MFEYRMHELRLADLLREAENARLVRQVRRARRAARRSAKDTGEGPVSRHSTRYERAA